MTLLLLGLTAAPVDATQQFTAAGMMLLARDEGTWLILLVRDRNRHWYEVPGGRHATTSSSDSGATKRKETAYATAIRECFEESRGYLKPERLRMLSDPTRFIRDGQFVIFFAIVEKFPIQHLLNNDVTQYRNRAAFQEVVDYAWVAVENVLAAPNGFVKDETGKRIQVRPQLRTRLERARWAGWFRSQNHKP